MLRKIVCLRIFKLLDRKYKYLQFPTTIQLGLMCPVPGHSTRHISAMGGARSTLHAAYTGTQPDCLEREKERER